MKKIIAIGIIALILLSGCIESQQLFDNTGSKIENENNCKEWCDETNDLQPFIEVKCEGNQCLCKCKPYFW